jgi:hypothetical protein
MSRILSDLAGTAVGSFLIEAVSATAARIKNVSGVLRIRNKADNADAALVASKLSASGNDIELNEDAAGSGADWLYTLRRPSSGMTAAVVLTLPANDGSPGEVLSTDGDGVTSWIAAGGSTDHMVKQDVTPLAFGSSSPVTMFTLPANGYISKIEFNVDTAFNGTAPTASIGIAGTTSKYMAATQVDLKTVGQYEVNPGIIPGGSTEALIITYAADSSSAGAARVVVHYAVPT